MGLLLGLAIVIAIFAFLLAKGPMQVPYLKSIISENLNQQFQNYSIRFDDLDVRWRTSSHSLEFYAHNIIIDPIHDNTDDQTIRPKAKATGVFIGIDLAPLLLGNISLKHFYLDQPRLDITLNEAMMRSLNDINHSQDAMVDGALLAGFVNLDWQNPALIEKSILDHLQARLANSALINFQEIGMQNGRINLLGMNQEDTAQALEFGPFDMVLRYNSEANDGEVALPYELAFQGRLFAQEQGKIRASLQFGNAANHDNQSPQSNFPSLRLAVALEGASPNAIKQRLGQLVPTRMAQWQGVIEPLNRLGFDQDIDLSLWLDLNQQGHPISGHYQLSMKDRFYHKGAVQFTDGKRMFRLNGSADMVINSNSHDLTFGYNGDLASLLIIDVKQGEIAKGVMDITGQDGQIQWSSGFTKPISFQNLAAKLDYDGANKTFLLHDLQLENKDDESQYRLSGYLKGLDDGKQHLFIDSHISNYQAGSLALHWPEMIVPDLRSWLSENIRDGDISKAQLVIGGVIEEQNQDAPFTLTKLFGDIQLENGVVRFHPDFPMALNVQSHMQFNETSYQATIHQANIDRLKIEQGQVIISDFDIDLMTDDQPNANIDIALNGDLARLLEIVEDAKLIDDLQARQPQKNLTGQAEVKLSLAFPLVDDNVNNGNDMTVIDYDILANLSQLEFDLPPFPKKFVANQMMLRMDNDDFNLSGDIDYDRMRLSVDYQQPLSPSGNQESLTLQGQLHESFIKTEFPSLTFYQSGPVGLDLTRKVNPSGIIDYVIALNLTEAKLASQIIDWQKQAGLPATANLQLKEQLEGDKTIFSLDNFIYKDDEMGLMQGRMNLNMDDQWDIASLNLAPLRLGSTNLSSLDFEKRMDGNRLNIKGEEINLSPFMDLTMGDSADDTGLENLSATIRLNHLRTDKGDGFGKSDINFRMENGRFRQLDAVLNDIADNQSLTVKIRPSLLPKIVEEGQVMAAPTGDENESRHLIVDGTDSTGFFEAMGIDTAIEGGSFALTAQQTDENSAFKGKLNITNFTLLDTPFLTRLIEAASLTGILNSLESGIKFDKMALDFSYLNQRLEIANAVASSLSVGLTGDGFIDQGLNEIKVNGLVIPAYGLNSFLNILPPTLANFVRGGKNEGVFATRYSITGEIDDYNVSANPFSNLTPGILRSIWNIGDGIPK